MSRQPQLWVGFTTVLSSRAAGLMPAGAPRGNVKPSRYDLKASGSERFSTVPARELTAVGEFNARIRSVVIRKAAF